MTVGTTKGTCDWTWEINSNVHNKVEGPLAYQWLHTSYLWFLALLNTANPACANDVSVVRWHGCQVWRSVSATPYTTTLISPPTEAQVAQHTPISPAIELSRPEKTSLQPLKCSGLHSVTVISRAASGIGDVNFQFCAASLYAFPADLRSHTKGSIRVAISPSTARILYFRSHTFHLLLMLLVQTMDDLQVIVRNAGPPSQSRPKRQLLICRLS